MSTDGNWVRVASVDDITEEAVTVAVIGDREIALYRLAGNDFRATDNICTHEYARLSEGWLEDHIIECPLHGGQFDIRSGKGLCTPISRDLETFEVRVEGDDVFVQLPD
jgi:naphthalene 1,2-dioxygenase system ferredoxin subunit